MSVLNLKEFKKKFQSGLYKSLIHTSTTVTSNTINKLQDLLENEKNNPIISSQLDLILENIEYAKKMSIPVCQDTGHINLLIQLGENFPYIPNFDALTKPILNLLTKASILRPNTVDPLTEKNPQDNTGFNFPPIYVELIPNSDNVVVSILNKGGGSENMSTLFMLNPANALEIIIPKILEHMKKSGGKPCPPTILGIGMGGDAVKAMYLAKKALFRPIGTKNSRKEIAKLENDILIAVNSLNIGVMGLGGNSNCLDVKIEVAMRHPATFPVGLIVECYCHRTASFQIKSDGSLFYGKLDNNFNFIEEGF